MLWEVMCLQDLSKAALKLGNFNTVTLSSLAEYDNYEGNKMADYLSQQRTKL